MSLAEDTIAAVATPPGRGAVSIVRVSGPEVPEIATGVLGRLPRARHATFLSFLGEDGVIDQGVALYFPAPRSFTGEHVLELHGHGGPVVTDLVLARVLSLGARIAEAGEFSRRAFLNDKLDLAQAEAIADLIDSGSSQAARAAIRSLRGEFSKKVQELAEALIGVRMYIEAAIDFPEEEIDFLSDGAVAVRVTAILQAFDELDRAIGQGCLLQEGMTIVIAGRPNAGKSSLLNRLAGYEAAIVTDIPGTTRDVVRERIDLDGLPLHVLDTAGLRAEGDVVEREGMRRTRAAMARADRVLLVIDASDVDYSGVEDLPEGVPVTVVRNKIDLTAEAPGLRKGDDPPTLGVSAKTGAGLDALKKHLEACVGFHGSDSATLSARRRHLDALRRARGYVGAARHQVEAGAGELAAEELREAQRALGEITGEFTSDDLLGRIFESFCIGK